MGEIINISDNIKESFEKNKEKYPNLQGFEYDENTDTLTFNGQTVSPAGYALSHTDPVFFQMIPQDIFTYLKNGFYFQSPNEISKIKNMITSELVITEDEENILKTFVKQYFKRLEIYVNNKLLFDESLQDIDLNTFVNNLLDRRNVIEGVKTGLYPNSVAANIIIAEYTQITEQLDNSQQSNKEMERPMTLTRKQPKSISYIFPEQEDVDRQVEREQRFGIAGFTSVVLIIATAITFGMYLALKLM